MTHRGRARLRKTVDGAVMAVIAVIALFPILWGFTTSLKATNRILEFPPRFIPDDPTLEHYRVLLETGVTRYIVNSGLVSILTVLVCLTIGVMSGYALARFTFVGKGLVMFAIVAVMSIPLVSLMVPTYTFLAYLGILDTRTSLVLLYSAYQLPVTVWILYGFFQTIPPQLEQAAQIDGYSRMEALYKVVVPLSKPGMVAAGLFVLNFAWNDFVVALVMTSSDAVRTLPFAIYNYLGYYGREWGPLTAASIISIVPVILLFIVFQRYFLSGITGGSVKG